MSDLDLGPLSEGPVPPLAPASLVKQRGEQRRRRQRGASSVAALALVLSVGGVAAALTGSDQDALQYAPPSPTPSCAPADCLAPDEPVEGTPDSASTAITVTDEPLYADSLVQAGDVARVLGGTWSQTDDRTDAALGLVVCPTGDGYAADGLVHELTRGPDAFVSRVVRVFDGRREVDLVRSDVAECAVRDGVGGARDTWSVTEPAEGRLLVRHGHRGCTGCATVDSVVLVLARGQLVSYLSIPAAEQARATTWLAVMDDRLDCGAADCGTGPTAAGYPKESAHVVQGARLWAVYLAVTLDDDAKLDVAEKEVKQFGYHPGRGQISCEYGGREGLGLPEKDYLSVALYFDTRPLAQEFVDAYRPGVVGTAQITYLCAD